MDQFLETLVAWEAAGRPVIHEGERKYLPYRSLNDGKKMLLSSHASASGTPDVTRIITVAASVAVTADLTGLPHDTLTASEAVFGFAAWLTGRAEAVTLGSAHGCAGIPDLCAQFIAANKLAPVRGGYHHGLTMPHDPVE